MNLLLQLAGLLPQPWIKFVSGAQWRHPRLKRGFAWCAELFRNQDGTILHGVGKGLRFNPGRANAGFLFGTSELAVQYALSVLAKPGMVMYDIGANVGFLTVITARLVGQQGRVIAFEPLSTNFVQIQHNAVLNGFTQVTARCEALSSTDGKATLQVSADPTWCKLVGVGSTVAQKVGEIEVTVSRLDTVLHEADLPLPDLIKIDVEGAEVDVLDGAAETLHKSRPILLIELHGTNRAIAERLKGLNYSAVRLGSSASIVDSPWDAYVIAAPSEHPDLVHSISALTETRLGLR